MQEALRLALPFQFRSRSVGSAVVSRQPWEDSQNRNCYNAIASEYAEPDHETCREFDRATAQLCSKLAPYLERFGVGFRYLDVGVGHGVTLKALTEPLLRLKAKVDVLDISEGMLSELEHRVEVPICNSYCQSVYDFHAHGAYDVIVASMADPYLRPAALENLSRALTTPGLLVISCPAPEWANSVRAPTEREIACFRTRTGTRVHSLSVCPQRVELEDYLLERGIKPLERMIISISRANDSGQQSNWAEHHSDARLPFYQGWIFERT